MTTATTVPAATIRPSTARRTAVGIVVAAVVATIAVVTMAVLVMGNGDPDAPATTTARSADTPAAHYGSADAIDRLRPVREPAIRSADAAERWVNR